MATSDCKLTILGGNGWIPAFNRHTCCYALELGDYLFIFDLGSGACRLGELYPPEKLMSFKEIHIFLSHYHLDHITGITYLPLYLKGCRVTIFGPGKNIYGKSTEEILSAHLEKPYFALPLADYPMDLAFVDIALGKNEIAGVEISTLLQSHSDPTIGYRLNDHLAYITDTACSPDTIDFVDGTNILLHETWFDNLEYTTLSSNNGSVTEDVSIALRSHANIDWVMHVAKKAQINTLVLIHLNPSYNDERLRGMLAYAKRSFMKTYLALDGTTILI
ncbi:MBL fold metallo-hydrolase [Desulfogranum marinum]|uniref:MBL fold metallo-hydrolase n=1 Tax=Desulfogranum marinum TaxID=453220 RepID=UPI001963A19F|nr:hypothetical protein [Desulfogranum marinum]